MEKRQENEVRVSVRGLVEFILRSGDIDNRRSQARDREAMQAGSRLHRRIQKQWGSALQTEVTLRCRIPVEEMVLVVEGRADGLSDEDGLLTVEEIKGVYYDVNRLEAPIEIHRAQALCYAAILARQRQSPRMAVRLIYVDLETDEWKTFREEWSAPDLEKWFGDLTAAYAKWALWQYRHRLERDASITHLPFPYPYRKGQKELAGAVYQTITEGRTLFIQAPTGIGKTLACVYPAVMAMGAGCADRLFYLTAKTVTRTVAEESLNLLRQKGLHFFSVSVTAKEKLCCLDRPDCNPDSCPYAKGHYDRINDVVFSLLRSETRIDRDILLKTAEEHKVCPYELCLDLAGWADGIICDYNYAFDPDVCLKRFFGEDAAGDNIFLVDEAHNLADRARQMYSASLYKEDFLAVRRLIKGHSRKLERSLTRCNQALLEMKRENGTCKVLPEIDHFILTLESLYVQMQEFAEDSHVMDGNETWQEFFFAVRHFLNMSEQADENYRIYTELLSDGRFMIRQLCVNPARCLGQYLEKGCSTIFYSATLLPMGYYRRLLRADADDYAVYGASPFDAKKRLLLVAQDVSSRYSRRGRQEYAKIYQYIRKMALSRQGHYLVYFPSYAFLEEVRQAGIDAEEDRRNNAGQGENQSADDGEFTILCQSSHMNEAQRDEFLAAFSGQTEPCDTGRSLVGYCVMGGIFAEGIDLAGEKLIGVIVVGTGLPQVCTEREILKEFYQENGQNGFDFAYRYPGMNKVMQAAGRVIRTAQDTGVIALLDYRFLEAESVRLFPREWKDYQVTDLQHFSGSLSSFWNSVSDTEDPMTR